MAARGKRKTAPDSQPSSKIAKTNGALQNRSFGPGLTAEEVRANPDLANELAKVEIYYRATNFLAGAMTYLCDNVLLREPLAAEHIKPRLLGHWGACPGINLVYAHMNRAIRQHNLNSLFVTGPGHGAPANLANLYLEGAITELMPEYTLDMEGLQKFIRGFSWPGGFASHVNAETPGSIHEGGELGYALAVAFGAAMDNPDLIVPCIIGDGEAESGPTAAAWHSIKWLDPVESGAVIPILNVNGYKIANPTIYGTMSNEELDSLFTGYGYSPRIVSGPDVHGDLFGAIEWALGEIRQIQEAARSGNPIVRPRWPMIVLITPKGYTGIRSCDGQIVEGSFRSHQVPAKECRTKPDHLKLVEEWFRSYNIEELFDEHGRPTAEVLANCPTGNARMGMNPHTNPTVALAPRLNLPDFYEFAVEVTEETRGIVMASNMESIGNFLTDVVRKNPTSFRIFSPDELESNKLGLVLRATCKQYQWPVNEDDAKTIHAHRGGRVTEMLSEHTLQGWLQGYLMTGRHGLFPSYEAFLGIVATMMDQYAKFMKMAAATSWRNPIPSMNYIMSSTLWRQEHNGFSHQNPGFINTLLNKKADMLRIYLPPDGNSMVCTMNHMLKSVNKINLVVSAKHPMPQWLSMDEAVAHCRAGASVWHWASTNEGRDPDVVLVGIGAEPTLEVMAAAYILRTECPDLRIRVVNITDLLVLGQDTDHPHGLDDALFEAMFTNDRPVIINFHGYPSAVRTLLFQRPHSSRFVINGYIEEGTTTTPFEMAIMNGTSRYHLVMQALRLGSKFNSAVSAYASERVIHYGYVMKKHRQYIKLNGEDPEEIVEWNKTGYTEGLARQESIVGL